MATKSSRNFWGLETKSLLAAQLHRKQPKGGVSTSPDEAVKTAQVFVQMGKSASVPKDWREHFFNTKSNLKQAIRFVDVEGGVRMLISPLAPDETEVEPALKAGVNVRLRDSLGSAIAVLEKLEVKHAVIGLELNDKQLPSALLGLELAFYRFKRIMKGETSDLKLTLVNRGRELSADYIEKATLLGRGVNLARHLTNLPPNLLNPQTYAQAIPAMFSGVPGAKVEIWDEKRLKKENMNLHWAVGQGASATPMLVHIRLRPKGAKGAPVAIVGKGITFDTGGLDIKPSAGMRLMKKDMGGSAAAAGIGWWAARSGLKVPLDIYLPLAENAISRDSFRPSDVIVARSGLSVEIHNTDAEGRLVLADALDVAVTQKEKPRAVIDIATLTGAIKVALGGGMAGLFSNSGKLSVALAKASSEAGDFAWPMPLFRKYNSSMSSNFADLVNAVDGFGGAVTAAGFLEKFVKDVPWAHLDIYAWKDSSEGAWCESGGSGQSVLGLAQYLQNL